MKIKKVFCIALAAMLVINTAACSAMSTISFGDRTLSVGVEGLTGMLNPFYCDTAADSKVLAQIFSPIQYNNGKGGLNNFCGGITYERVDGGIKYTVNIDDDLTFSDGTHATIDDVIAFYHFIADASYDGKYSDWHLNSIQGLAEYYYDDPNCVQAVNDIEISIVSDYTRSTIGFDDYKSYLVATALDGAWTGDVNASSPYGNTWREQIISAGFEDELTELGEAPSEDKLLSLAAEAEIETHSSKYNPESYWREKLYNDYLTANYSDGINVRSISGIKKVNDYACTVLFTQPDIDAASKINVPVVSADYYFAEYQKGNAEAVKGITTGALGAGPYALRDYDADSGIVTLVSNGYSKEKGGFDLLEFVEIASEQAPDALLAGTVDVIEIPETASAFLKLSVDGVKISATEQESYYSFFFNTKTLDIGVRTALMYLNNYTSLIEGKIGKYFTALRRPMNIMLYNGTSAGESDIYKNEGTDISSYLAAAGYTVNEGKCVKNVTSGDDAQTVTAVQLAVNFYYCDDCDDVALAVTDSFVKSLEANGISVNSIKASRTDFDAAVASGSADIWFDSVCDTVSGDKYDYYHSAGLKNYTGIKNSELDTMLSNLNASAASQRTAEVEDMLEALMAAAVEMPVYQRKTLTAYNTNVIAADSVPEISDLIGCKYILNKIKPA